MSEILLLRHGKSDWSANVDDFHRPLKQRGIQAAEKIGEWLYSQKLIPDQIWSSPAVRAMQTTKHALQAFDMLPNAIQENEAIYEASLATLRSVFLQAAHDDGITLIVGHNPSMELLVMNLVGEQLPSSRDGKVMPTGTLAHIQVLDNDRVLKALIRPKSIDN